MTLRTSSCCAFGGRDELREAVVAELAFDHEVADVASHGRRDELGDVRSR